MTTCECAGFACRLVDLLSPIDCKVNLIVFNTHEGTRFRPSTHEAVQAFRSIVIQVPWQTQFSLLDLLFAMLVTACMEHAKHRPNYARVCRVAECAQCETAAVMGRWQPVVSWEPQTPR